MSGSGTDASRALLVAFLAAARLDVGVEPARAVAQAAAAVGREGEPLPAPLAGRPVVAGRAVLRAGQALPVALLAQPEPGGTLGHAAGSQQSPAPAAQAVPLEGAVTGQAAAVALLAGPLDGGEGPLGTLESENSINFEQNQTQEKKWPKNDPKISLGASLLFGFFDHLVKL